MEYLRETREVPVNWRHLLLHRAQKNCSGCVTHVLWLVTINPPPNSSICLHWPVLVSCKVMIFVWLQLYIFMPTSMCVRLFSKLFKFWEASHRVCSLPCKSTWPKNNKKMPFIYFPLIINAQAQSKMVLSGSTVIEWCRVTLRDGYIIEKAIHE